jgi:DNA repair exonuclease SbcCD ATPase subunit
MPYDYENRINKVEEAISKLTDISADMNKMIAIQDIRVNQQEKVLELLEDLMEKRRGETDARFNSRREEVDSKIKELYDRVSEDIDSVRSKLDETNKEVHGIEKTVWMYVGGLAVFGFLSSHLDTVMKFFKTM